MASQLQSQPPSTNGSSNSINVCEVCQMEHQHITEDWVTELRQDMTYSDVTFLVGDDLKPVLAHKCILAIRSPVFKQMFLASMIESISGEVRIHDISIDAVEAFVDCIYTSCSERLIVHASFTETYRNMTILRIVQVLSLAHMYQIPTIVSYCEMLLKGVIISNPDIAFDLFLVGYRLENYNLKKKAHDSIQLYVEFLKTKGTQDAKRNFKELFITRQDVAAGLAQFVFTTSNGIR